MLSIRLVLLFTLVALACCDLVDDADDKETVVHDLVEPTNPNKVRI